MNIKANIVSGNRADTLLSSLMHEFAQFSEHIKTVSIIENRKYGQPDSKLYFAYLVEVDFKSNEFILNMRQNIDNILNTKSVDYFGRQTLSPILRNATFSNDASIETVVTRFNKQLSEHNKPLIDSSDVALASSSYSTLCQ